MIKQAIYKTKGMNRDLAASAFNPEFAYENKNIRILATDDNTQLSLCNEKGNRHIIVEGTGELDGIPIGLSIIDKDLILFVLGTKNGELFEIKVPPSEIKDIPFTETEEPSISTKVLDKIYKINKKGNRYFGDILFKGELGFDYKHPIEAISQFENEKIKKVYWTDGKNLPRVINVALERDENNKWNEHSFDFSRTLKLKEDINIKRNIAAGGIFSPGVIQYAFTYYSKYGLESNVFYTSPLYYISYNNRGASPEDSVSNSFSIYINGELDTTFDYLRIYSIHRSSLNAVPEVKRVIDISTSIITKEGKKIKSIYTDGGTSGEIIDPTELFYKGCEDIIVLTLLLKDNTLFLGNIELNKPVIKNLIRDEVKKLTITYLADKNLYEDKGGKNNNFLRYENQLSRNSEEIKTFKFGETYRFGILLLDGHGKWSEPLFINDVKNTIRVNDSVSLDKQIVSLVSAGCKIKKELVLTFTDLGYKRVRPVVVYPKIQDRNILCQGILCPTVFNVADRDDDSPFALASWFARPNASNNVFDINTSNINLGTFTEFRHYHSIPDNIHRNAEILCITNPPESPVYPTITKKESWVAMNKDNFFIDQSILTFHSPEIEFNSEVKSIDYSKLGMRIVGAVPITTTTTDIDILTSTTTEPYFKSDKNDPQRFPPGFYKEKVGMSNNWEGWKGMVSGFFWLDEVTGRGKKANGPTGFMVYPWHRNGSMNNDNNRVDEKGNLPFRASLLSKKKMSNLRYSTGTFYIEDRHLVEGKSFIPALLPEISGMTVFDSNEVSMVKIPSLIEGGESIAYYGNIDKVITTVKENNPKGGYPIIVSKENTSNQFNPHNIFTGTPVTLESLNTATGIVTGTEPVRIKYKSSPHVVLALKVNKGLDDNLLSTALPTIGVQSGETLTPINGVNGEFAFGDKAFFNDKIGGIQQTVINKNIVFGGRTSITAGWFWLAEIYRKDEDINNRFGGNTEEAFENNEWLPCGEPVYLEKDEEVNVRWTEGDTYYLRYDCLKTYPFTLEDQNSVTDIVSFMCETRVNIDGRYDRNRSLTSNLVMTPTNFNKINTAYSLTNNFFNYRGYNEDKLHVKAFNNTVTWTKTKTLGELIDSWTNVTLASTLDLDGDKGQINAIRRFDNNLISFLDRGISLIMYNDNMQITTTEGVPIEIANSGKVTGKRYISDKVGCHNKWSICLAPSGLYFIDDYSKDIFLFNGKINNVSDSKGFHSWINSKIKEPAIWNPVDFNNFVTYYDNKNNDILFVGKEDCLAFSEPLGEFSSFYSYENSAYIISYEDSVIDIKMTKYLLNEENEKDGEYSTKMWEQNEGDYNYFFGRYKPFSTTVVVNPDPTKDKIFNNVEFRSDSYKLNKGVWELSNDTFDTIIAENEYLYGELSLSNIKNRPSSLKKKFRVWRANIPRDNKDNPYGGIHGNRIRNPWIYLTLKRGNVITSYNSLNKEKTILHDLIVNYFE